MIDEDEWLRLRLALWPDHQINALKKEMEHIQADFDQQPVFVAEREAGGLCGFVEVSIRRSAPGCRSNSIGYIEAWHVDPEWRSQSDQKTGQNNSGKPTPVLRCIESTNINIRKIKPHPI